jgi:hypothetical protein
MRFGHPSQKGGRRLNGTGRLNGTMLPTPIQTIHTIHTMPSAYADDEQRVEKAVNAYLQGLYPSIADAAREFNAKYRRVLNRLHGKNSRSSRTPTNLLLSPEEEKGLVAWLKYLDTICMRATKQMLERECNWLLARRVKGTDMPPQRCGDHWAQRFLKRYPEIILRKERSRELDRECAEDVEGLEKWFTDWERVITRENLIPRDVYNFDESPIRLGQGGSQKKITAVENKEISAGKNTNRDSLTIAEAISASGDFAAPVIILPGVELLEKWTKARLPGRFLLTTSPAGYITDELFYDWLINIFGPASKKLQLGAKRLLLLDGHTTHLTIEVWEYCKEENIILFTTPPHLTHLVQPLDVGVFGPWKKNYRDAIDQSYQTGCTNFDKLEFLDSIYAIRKRTFKVSTVVHAWKKAGLLPINPAVVLEPLKARLAYRRPPSPSTRRLGEYPTPTTSRSLQRTIKLLKDGGAEDLSYDTLVDKMLRGSQIIAHQNTFLKRSLAATTAAEMRRQELRKESRRTIPTAGIVSVAQCRRMVKDRALREAEQEAEKQVRRLKRAENALARRYKPILAQIKKEIKEGYRLNKQEAAEKAKVAKAASRKRARS